MSLNITKSAEHIDREVIPFHQNSEQVKKGINFNVGHTDMCDHLFLEISPDFTKIKKKSNPYLAPTRQAESWLVLTHQAEQWVFLIPMFLTEICDMFIDSLGNCVSNLPTAKWPQKV